MSANTKIEWTDHTFNPWWGCQKVGPGCDHCYAETLDKRTGGQHWGPGVIRRRTSAKNWNDPYRWNDKADAFFAEHGRRQRVFCASMADVFDNAVDPAWRADLLFLIEQTQNLDWLLLTKRIGNVKQMVAEASEYLSNVHRPLDWPLPNVCLGATIVNQEEADRDIPKLLDVPAAKRFLSMEPLLGPVDLTRVVYPPFKQKDENDPYIAYDTLRGHMIGPDDVGLQKLDWVIVGGESGPGARPMHPDWARSLRDQCESAGVPYLFKQWGEWMPTIKDGDTVKLVFQTGAPHGPGQPVFHDWADGAGVARVGKKAAGRMLDGRTWDGVPSMSTKEPDSPAFPRAASTYGSPQEGYV